VVDIVTAVSKTIGVYLWITSHDEGKGEKRWAKVFYVGVMRLLLKDVGVGVVALLHRAWDDAI
jgi:hypothetical protein